MNNSGVSLSPWGGGGAWDMARGLELGVEGAGGLKGAVLGEKAGLVVKDSGHGLRWATLGL